MSTKALMDEIRNDMVTDGTLMPMREISYTRVSDGVTVTPLFSFVGAGLFNQEEKEMLEEVQSFGGLKLEQDPKVNDKVSYDGKYYLVTRFTKLGQLYTVYGKLKRHKGRGLRS